MPLSASPYDRVMSPPGFRTPLSGSTCRQPGAGFQIDARLPHQPRSFLRNLVNAKSVGRRGRPQVPKMIETRAKQRSTVDLLRYLAERIVRGFEDLVTDTAESSLAWPKPSEHRHEPKAVIADTGPRHAEAKRDPATTI
jgi:hypothetical protein